MIAVNAQMWQLLLLVALAVVGANAWNKDAGLVQPLGGAQRTVTVSSNGANKAVVQNIIDGRYACWWDEYSIACLHSSCVDRALKQQSISTRMCACLARHHIMMCCSLLLYCCAEVLLLC